MRIPLLHNEAFKFLFYYSGGGGWQDKWQESGGGRSSNPSGFKDHSDEEGSRGPSPDVAEFRDEDNDFSPTSQPSSLSSNKFSDMAPSQPTNVPNSSRYENR